MVDFDSYDRVKYGDDLMPVRPAQKPAKRYEPRNNAYQGQRPATA